MFAVAATLALALGAGGLKMGSSPLPALADVFPASSHVVAPSVGSYAIAVDYELTAYPTREIYVHERKQWAIALTLAEGGVATARVRWKDSRHSSVSEYASRDGEKHTDERKDEGDLRLRGTWTREDARIRVHLETKDLEAPLAPQSLRCVALPGRAHAPGLLVCQVETRFGPIADRLGIGAQGQSRAWLPLTAEDAPWLVLGGSPGVALRWEDERGRIKSRLATPEKPLSEEDLPLPKLGL